MRYINTGVTRLVFLVGNYAIKIPNFEFEHAHFLMGCVCNWKERRYWKLWSTCKWDVFEDLTKKVTPTLWCSWFGLIQIQERVKPLGRELTDAEIEFFSSVCTDIKEGNFGINNSGQVVCVDYGQ